MATRKPMSLVRELFIIPLAGRRYVVYAPLQRTAFVANATMVNALVDLREGRDGSGDDRDNAIAGLARRLDLIEDQPDKRPDEHLSGDPEPTIVSLFLTTACNLRCDYCYASAGDRPKRFMDLRVAKRGIDFVAANAKRGGSSRFEIAYHGGGEPTLNWATLTGSLDYARRLAVDLGLTVDAGIATNGMVSDRHLDWIIANLDGASVSLDGFPEVHDRHRRTVAGRGSSARVTRTLRRFDDAGFPYGLRVTVAADEISVLPDSIDFICQNFGTPHIQVEPVYRLGRWSGHESAETKAFIHAFRAARARARRLGRDIYFSAARLETLTNHFCQVSRDSFCLSPEGNVSACYEAFAEDVPWATEFFYGRYDESAERFVFDTKVLTALRGQSLDHRPYCVGCYARWHCAGDCHYKALVTSGGGPFAGSPRCDITRELIKDDIVARIHASGGLVWRDVDETAAAGCPQNGGC